MKSPRLCVANVPSKQEAETRRISLLSRGVCLSCGRLQLWVVLRRLPYNFNFAISFGRFEAVSVYLQSAVLISV